MDAKALNEEKATLEKKLKTLRQQKEKLSGSKNKRDRQKVNKQISQTQRRLEVLHRELERIEVTEAKKKVEAEKQLQKIKEEEKQKREDKSYIQECEEKHKLKDATLDEIKERIYARKAEPEDFHYEKFWDGLILEEESSMAVENEKQSKFLKAHGLTQADMDETVRKIRERREKAELEKLSSKSETEPEAKEEDKPEMEEKETAVQTEEVVFLDAEEAPKPFPGYKVALENSDSDGPEKAGPSEVPEEFASEKPLEPLSAKSASEAPLEVEETVEAKSSGKGVKKFQRKKRPTTESAETESQPQSQARIDKKNYGSSQYWDERYAQFADKTEEWYEGWKTLKDIIAPHISKDMMILDFGCGDSFMQDELYKDGFRCFGTDISNVVLQRLSEKPEREMFTADGFALPLRTNTWDAIIDKGTLDAIACDEKRNLTPLFEEVYRVLAPGGRYLVVTPWHADKRIPQLNKVPWTISHHVMPMSLTTLAKQRFNQLKGHPRLGRDRKKLMEMSVRQAKSELAALDIENAKNLPPERSCVIHCYVCEKIITSKN